jgi:hypothetical protein
MIKPPSIKDEVDGWVASNATDALADYATRGRKHQHLTDDELLNAWRKAFAHMADDVRDYERRAATEDLKSEFILRKKEPPYDLIRAEFERYMAEANRAIEELEADDPAQYEKMGREIETDLEKFRSSRDKSKN